jgi:hypothetical protein
VEAAAADCQILACKEIKIIIQIFQGKNYALKGRVSEDTGVFFRVLEN